MDANVAAHLQLFLKQYPGYLGQPLVDIAATMDWYAEYDDRANDNLNVNSYHCLMSPFRSCVMHAPEPRSALIEGRRRHAPAGGLVTNVFEVSGSHEELVIGKAIVSHSGTQTLGHVTIPLDETGHARPNRPDGLFACNPSSFWLDWFHSNGGTPEDAADDLLNQFHPVFFALALLHAKNVRLDADALPRQVRRAANNSFVEAKFYTLHVGAIRAQAQAATAHGESSVLRALHLVRGSFATYTTERPLFGKVTGTFWRPAHLKGKPEAGVVVKDYRVIKPPETT